MSEWIKPSDDDPSTWWPSDKRILACDKHGWINIVMLTENGFELDDGGEAGCTPVVWMHLPEALPESPECKETQ